MYCDRIWFLANLLSIRGAGTSEGAIRYKSLVKKQKAALCGSIVILQFTEGLAGQAFFPARIGARD